MARDIDANLQSYTWRTGGSTIKQSDSELTWDFGNADPQWGQQNAAAMRKDLEHALRDQPVRVTSSKTSITILPKGMEKGVAVVTILREFMEEKTTVTFWLSPVYWR